MSYKGTFLLRCGIFSVGVLRVLVAWVAPLERRGAVGVCSAQVTRPLPLWPYMAWASAAGVGVTAAVEFSGAMGASTTISTEVQPSCTVWMASG